MRIRSFVPSGRLLSWRATVLGSFTTLSKRGPVLLTASQSLYIDSFASVAVADTLYFSGSCGVCTILASQLNALASFAQHCTNQTMEDK